jgi:hypothetical protein
MDLSRCVDAEGLARRPANTSFHEYRTPVTRPLEGRGKLLESEADLHLSQSATPHCLHADLAEGIIGLVANLNDRSCDELVWRIHGTLELTSHLIEHFHSIR